MFENVKVQKVQGLWVYNLLEMYRRMEIVVGSDELNKTGQIPIPNDEDIVQVKFVEKGRTGEVSRKSCSVTAMNRLA